MSRYFDVPIVHWCVIEEALLFWCNDFKSFTEVAFYLMTLQSLTGVVFALLMLKWSRCCISPVDVTMTHRNLDPSWHRCCSKTKENIYIDKHSYFRKELKYLHCWIVVQPIRICQHKYLMKSWKRRKVVNYKCQAEAMCKFSCCKPMNMLYVDLYIVYHPDSVILVCHGCHWYLYYWYSQCHPVDIL